MKAKHSNISIFIPHLGCPNMCSFCNQRTISHTVSAPTADEVTKMLEAACERLPEGTAEIAFFGGSFTAVERDYMTSLLDAAQPFLRSGNVSGIRVSTRPDCIDEDVLEILKKYGVTAIELGAQSMDDEVLAANNRGHTAEDVRKAAALIKKHGFELGLQMMTGLYKSDPETDWRTAEKIAEIKPDTVRIYPTVILSGTRLGELFGSGEYVPYGFETAAELCADMLEMFEREKIRVIKLGLHASETVEGDMLGGFYHPAFREICEGILFRRAIESRIAGEKSCVVYTAPNAVSKAAGQKRCNIDYFGAKGVRVKIRPDESLKNREIILKKDE